MKDQESKYDLQTEKFVEETGIKIVKTYLCHGFHFDGDQEQRAIWEISLIRENRPPFSFRFGQSIVESYKMMAGFPIGYNMKVIPFNMNVRGMKEILHQGGGNLDGNTVVKKITVPPSDYDILACITKYDPGTFANFCADYGYDTDSRKAEKTYFAVQEEWSGVRSLFTDAELEKLQEIS